MLETRSIDWLESQVKSVYLRGFNLKTLANLALEVIINKGILEDRLAKGGLSDEKRQEIEKNIERLKRLERYIIQMYYSLTATASARARYPWLEEMRSWKE